MDDTDTERVVAWVLSITGISMADQTCPCDLQQVSYNISAKRYMRTKRAEQEYQLFLTIWPHQIDSPASGVTDADGFENASK